jgi:predicted TPR repeat methyltransferase
MTMGKQADVHVKILNAQSTDALISVYDDWAHRYEKELLDDWGYTSPQMAVTLLQRYYDIVGSTVLDAGCGTGLVGALLSRAGVSDLSGVDYSQGMLDKAQDKGVYHSLAKIDLNKEVPIASASYDAITCIGTFTSTHVVPEALRELVRLTRSGGVVVFTVRDDYWEATEFIDLIIELHSEGAVRVEEIRVEPYIHSEGSECRFVVLSVL